MSIRPETVALLDRFIGPDQSIYDALSDIEQAVHELHQAVEHLEVHMRSAALALQPLGASLTEEQRDALSALHTEAEWSRQSRDGWRTTVVDAIEDIEALVEQVR